MGPAVLIVIANPRTSGAALDCLGLRSVVGNPSGDGSRGDLQAAFAESGWSRWSSDRDERRCA
jgi:hypothetical protein